MSQGGRQIARAAIVVMALFALSRLLGVVRQMAIAAQFGTGRRGGAAYFAPASGDVGRVFFVVWQPRQPPNRVAAMAVTATRALECALAESINRC